MTYYNDGTAGRDALVNTTRWLGGARTIPTGKRLYAPHSDDVGKGVVDAVGVVDGAETTIVSPQGGAAALALLGTAGVVFQSTKN